MGTAHFRTDGCRYGDGDHWDGRSVAGNEAALRVGRRRWIICVMLASMVCAAIVSSPPSGVTWRRDVYLYNALLRRFLGLNLGAIAHAEPERKGAIMAVRATRYGGGFVGPYL